MSNPRANRNRNLLEHLNAAQFAYPGAKLQLVYSIAGEAETPNSDHNRIPQIRRSGARMAPSPWSLVPKPIPVLRPGQPTKHQLNHADPDLRLAE